jgi:hypothetical protein
MAQSDDADYRAFQAQKKKEESERADELVGTVQRIGRFLDQIGFEIDDDDKPSLFASLKEAAEGKPSSGKPDGDGKPNPDPDGEGETSFLSRLLAG